MRLVPESGVKVVQSDAFALLLNVLDPAVLLTDSATERSKIGSLPGLPDGLRIPTPRPSGNNRPVSKEIVRHIELGQ